MTLLELAMKLRPYIEKAVMSLDDVDALESIPLFPHWIEGKSYVVDDKVQYNDALYRCLQSHVAQANWTPTDAASLWAKILIPDPEVIPDWEQPTSTNPYQIGDKVRFEGRVYESVIANNVWAPNVYGWKEI